MIKRYLEKNIADDVRQKMVFISGPRQVGKTTLAGQIGENYFLNKSAYLNWDDREDRKTILDGAFNADKRLIIFDEIHKYKNWKNYLKGVYDKHKTRFNMIVTGSARLDIFRKGGDSLLGRYHSYRLHPLSVRELSGHPAIPAPMKEPSFAEESKDLLETFEALFKFGGFPEIFTRQSDSELRRWHNERGDRLIKEDIRDIENLRDISSLQVLVNLLPGRVGSLFSLNSLREDLGVTHKTLAHWVDVLENFYYHFRIYPYQNTLIKSLRKEPKLYLWDWSELQDENVRLENMIASHLHKFCEFQDDAEGYKTDLFYLRDKEQREVDFLVCAGGRPWFCVEVKNSFKEVPAALKYFGGKLKIPFLYLVVKEGGKDVIRDSVRIMSAAKFLTGLV